MSASVLFLFLLSSPLLVAAAKDPVVKLPHGAIRGLQKKTCTGKTYYSFQKIPFAAPPVGKLRFKAPVPPDCWDGILNTTLLDVICYQVGITSPEQTEDCLYLNVYTPKLPNKRRRSSIPVLLYIYGGGFMRGSAKADKLGPEYLVDEDIIVVTTNYRLGPFGFISTEDDVIPGNAGLKDQLFAIKWTHDNIHLFGGDPRRITISGESSGGWAVGFHVLNTKSAGLYSGAIMESGTPLSEISIERNARAKAFLLASVLNNSSGNDSSSLLHFLQSVSAEDLNAATSLVPGGWSAVIEPKHDGAILTDKMYGLMKEGKVVKVPIIIGMTAEETIGDVADLDALRAVSLTYDTNVSSIVPSDMRITDVTKLNEVCEAIRRLYCGNGTFSEDLARTIRLRTDFMVARPSIKSALLLSRHTDVYFYEFSYDGELGNNSLTYPGTGNVGHTEELKYLWRTTVDGYDNSDLSKYPKEDVLTQHRMLRLWSDFVKYGNPTPRRSHLLQNVIWPRVSPRDGLNLVYLDINSTLTVKSTPRSGTYIKWIELYNSLGYDDFDTY